MGEDTPKYILVENYIKQAIETKQIESKLPGERTLAQELGYSYMTIRKAIDNLVQQGLLYKVPPKGTYVNTNKSGRKRTKTIGYFLDKDIKAGVASPYYSLVMNAIVRVAQADDYSVVYFSNDNTEQMRNTLLRLDGVIASCFPRVENTIICMKQTVPVVVIENGTADKTIPSIIIDNFNAGVQSVDYAASLEHSRIGLMTGLEDSDVGKNRFAGFQHGLQRHNIEIEKDLIFSGDYSYESGMAGAEYFLSLAEKPTAIICANDSMALGALQYLNQVGLDVPEDMSIIGFDDIEVASQIVPKLTTIAAPVDEIAQSAFTMLKQLINGAQSNRHEIALPAQLVVRQSCQAKKGSTEHAAPKLSLVENKFPNAQKKST